MSATTGPHVFTCDMAMASHRKNPSCLGGCAMSHVQRTSRGKYGTASGVRRGSSCGKGVLGGGKARSVSQEKEALDRKVRSVARCQGCHVHGRYFDVLAFPAATACRTCFVSRSTVDVTTDIETTRDDRALGCDTSLSLECIMCWVCKLDSLAHTTHADAVLRISLAMLILSFSRASSTKSLAVRPIIAKARAPQSHQSPSTKQCSVGCSL